MSLKLKIILLFLLLAKFGVSQTITYDFMTKCANYEKLVFGDNLIKLDYYYLNSNSENFNWCETNAFRSYRSEESGVNGETNVTRYTGSNLKKIIVISFYRRSENFQDLLNKLKKNNPLDGSFYSPRYKDKVSRFKVGNVYYYFVQDFRGPGERKLWGEDIIISNFRIDDCFPL